MRTFNYILTTLLLTTLLAASCSDDEQQTDNGTASTLQLNISEATWQNEELRLTRAATAAEAALQTSTDGFGLYCEAFNMENNTKVAWDADHQRWNYGDQLLWKHKRSSTVDMYAYAPYDADGTYADGSSFSVSAGVLTFNTTTNNTTDNTTDLLCAGAVRVKQTDHQGTINLNFQHVLAKLSFGTITNHYGRNLTLSSIDVSGTLYSRRKLSMATGVWRDEDAISSATNKTYASLNQEVAAGETSDIAASVTPLLLIPDPTVTVAFTFTTADFGTETTQFSIPLKQGVHKTLNLTITNNFEVIIDD